MAGDEITADAITDSGPADNGSVAIAEDTPGSNFNQGSIASEEGAQPSPDAGAVSSAGARPPVPQYELASEDVSSPFLKANLASYTEACRANGLSEAQAKAVMQWQESRIADIDRIQQRETARALKAWDDEVKSDSDFGGSNYTRTIADARKALAAFDPDGSLRELLRDTHGQYHPAVIRYIARVGRAMGEHEYVSGGGLGGASQTSLAERMYGPNGTEIKHPL